MYTALKHDVLLSNVMEAVSEAWIFREEKCGCELRLNEEGFVPATQAGSLSRDDLKQLLLHVLNHLYVRNGSALLRQVCGLPMGIEPAPQLANLACYACEARFARQKGPRWSGWIRRYIDDLFVVGEEWPSEEEYGMGYNVTSVDPSNLVYIGIRLYKDEKGEAHSTLYDRALDYPVQIKRYPPADTVAPMCQLRGVLLGRFVVAQRVCSHMGDFREAVAGVMWHAHQRHYSRRLVHRSWTRFLHQYWHQSEVTTRELRSWFHEVWNKVSHQLRPEVRSSMFFKAFVPQEHALAAPPPPPPPNPGEVQITTRHAPREDPQDQGAIIILDHDPYDDIEAALDSWVKGQSQIVANALAAAVAVAALSEKPPVEQMDDAQDMMVEVMQAGQPFPGHGTVDQGPVSVPFSYASIHIPAPMAWAARSEYKEELVGVAPEHAVVRVARYMAQEVLYRQIPLAPQVTGDFSDMTMAQADPDGSAFYEVCMEEPGVDHPPEVTSEEAMLLMWQPPPATRVD
jgi:hypothetical protein